MFTEETDTSFNILADGRINVTVITSYFKDGVKVGENNWGCCLEPNIANYEQAKTFLNEYSMSIIDAVWTQEVMDAYEKKIEQQKIDFAAGVQENY